MPSTPRRLPQGEPKERSKFGRRLFAMSPERDAVHLVFPSCGCQHFVNHIRLYH
jgi:hypothetical protein